METFITINDMKTVLEKHHTGLIILMPGSADCPGSALIAQQQKVVMGLNGCPRCLLYAMRALMEQQPNFKKLCADALNPNFTP